MESGLLSRPKLKLKVNTALRKEGRKEARKFLVFCEEGQDVVETQDCWLQAQTLAWFVEGSTVRRDIRPTNVKGAGAELVGQKCGSLWSKMTLEMIRRYFSMEDPRENMRQKGPLGFTHSHSNGHLESSKKTQKSSRNRLIGACEK